MTGLYFCSFFLVTGLLASSGDRMAYYLRQRDFSPGNDTTFYNSGRLAFRSPYLPSPEPSFKPSPKVPSILVSRSCDQLDEDSEFPNSTLLDFKRQKIDVENVRKTFSSYSVIPPEESFYVYALGVLNIFEKYSDSALNLETNRRFMEDLLHTVNQDTLEHDYLLVALISAIVFRQYMGFRMMVELLPQFQLPKETFDKFSKKVFETLFSSKIKLPELSQFLPKFTEDGLLSFYQFAAHLKTYRKTTVDLDEIRDHLDYAFSLIDLSSATIDTCIANVSFAHDISAVGYLFHSFIRNPSVPDSYLNEGITTLLSKENLKVVEIASITIVSSYFRPQCFEKLYRFCDQHKKLEALLPYLDYSQKTVCQVVHSKLQHFDDTITVLKKAISRAAGLNIPCDFLLLLLSKKLRIEESTDFEDYLVEMSKTTYFESIVKSLGLIEVELDYDYLVNELDFNSCSVYDFLIVSTRSPLLFRFPLQYLPRLATKDPRVISRQIDAKTAQNQLVATALQKVEFDESVKSYWLALGLVSYAASGVLDFVEYLIQSDQHQLLVDLAHYFRFESSYTCVSFEESLKRGVTLVNYSQSVSALRIIVDYEEYIVLLI